MQIGVPRESSPSETRVAATPSTVPQLLKLGYDVVVERGAGQRADFPDSAYTEAGARLGEAPEVWASDVVLACNPPTDEELALMLPGATLVSMLSPALHPEVAERYAEAGISALSLDAVPRISRAQALDVLSSMANIAGYRAVIEAAQAYGGMFTGQVTAAGKVPPARVFVVGAGVAGLAAIGIAGSMGAQVRAFDVRPEVGEQIESMGATFVEVGAVDTNVSSDGYAKEMTADQAELAARMYAEESRTADIIVTTAQIRGKAAPILLTAEMIAAMKPGSVIVDMAASTGGNTALTRADEKVVTDNGVTIIGWTDLAGRLPRQASQLLGTNLVNLLKLVTPEKDGRLVLDFDDEVVRSMTVTRKGAVTWPPPPVKVSAAAPAPVATPAAEVAKPTESPAELARRKRTRNLVAAGLAMVIFFIIGGLSPLGILGHWMVLMLAVFVGFYVISNVTHALHTPLMAETNAISGIIMVGALLQVGSSSVPVTILSWVAILVASINVFGGFLVTNRMLAMFRKA
ncbi:Re/Si-specific NAD(P)(+) transhydrogenase subunit alpha [Raineyella sp. LH-20]|uniref:Re/Si-specific NAD(P)(+) transhydrogenase subunit alpha n=1 Tax=Raineyella sp. LH-20 TaxID=3081204 RepID=UPI002953DAA3|nr:Re/Si-specific NAD(P)(+) transhydrogenase subunit alpha [Raineyella sp. LH-20]WOP17447.1 Re/Si-specific NAD(P)(+) transhydrogenase subunit alpha [Raineyella sp. LH-20]